MVQIKEKPNVVYTKRAEVEKNRVIIPKKFIDQHGRLFYMEVYNDKIIIKPRKEGE